MCPIRGGLNLRDDNPRLWNDLQTYEDEEMGDDDSEVPTREVVVHVVTKKTRNNRRVKAEKGGGLSTAGEAEAPEAEIPVGADDGGPAEVDFLEARHKHIQFLPGLNA